MMEIMFRIMDFMMYFSSFSGIYRFPGDLSTKKMCCVVFKPLKRLNLKIHRLDANKKLSMTS
jgi:hypothetical protein